MLTTTVVLAIKAPPAEVDKYLENVQSAEAELKAKMQLVTKHSLPAETAPPAERVKGNSELPPAVF